MFSLFLTRRFAPLFTTQFFGAFNDNFLKCAILTLVTFRLGFSDQQAAMLSNLALALFILPFFLFSAFAGQIADHFDKAPLARVIKFAEIILMVLAAGAFAIRSVPALLAVLCLMGLQSTFFGPVKYALLPQHLASHELVAGNALVSGGTFVAILIGSVGGTLFIALPYGYSSCSGVLILFALIGYLASRAIPSAPPARRARVRFRPVGETIHAVRFSFRIPVLRRTILALSSFWLIGSLFISQLPGICRSLLHSNETVNTLFFFLFSIGIALGSLLASALLRGKISPRLAGPAMLVMTLFSLDLAWVTLAPPAVTLPSPGFNGLQIFRCSWLPWRVSCDLIGIAVAGGVFTVPLQALMQHAAPFRRVATVIGCNNIVNSLFMAGGAIAVAVMIQLLHIPLGMLIAGIALLCAALTVYSFGTWRSR